MDRRSSQACSGPSASTTVSSCWRMTIPGSYPPPAGRAALLHRPRRRLANVKFEDVGLVDYLAAWDLQREVHQHVADGEQADTTLLLEHPAVFTAGKRTQPHDRPVDPHGAPVVDVDR